MRVVLDGRIVLPQMTGAGRYVVEIARRLPLLDPRLQLHVLLLSVLKQSDTARVLGDAGARIHFCSARVASLRQWLEIPRVLRRIRPDLYHYPVLDLPYVSCRSVVTIYDLNPVLDRHYFARQPVFRRFAARTLLRSTLRRCRLALTISDTVRRLLEETYPVARGKTRTVRLGVGPMFAAHGTSAQDGAAAALNGDSRWGNRPYVLYLGVDRPHKNLVRLVRAFVRFSASRPWPHGEAPYLWLAGVGEGSRQLRHELERLGVSEAVRRTSSVPETSLERLYRGARVVAYVSTSEGFGLPILEALAAGVPVVSANTSSLPETAGDAAVYVSPTDDSDIARGLGEAWGNEGLRSVLAARGSQRVKELSWDRTAQATLQAYSDAMQQGPSFAAATGT